MYLKSDSLVIRNATAGDARILCNWWNDGKVMAHAGFPNGINTTERDDLEKLKAENDRNRRLILEVDGVPVGEMCYRTVATNMKNTRAQHVYEKIGFRKVAVKVDSWKDQLGEWQSSVDYEMVKE